MAETDKETTETDDDGDTVAEFGALLADTEREVERLKKLATAAKGKIDIEAIYGELAGTVVQLVQDVVATCGGAFESIEDRLDEIEDRISDESQLSEEDAKRYVDVLEAHDAIVAQMLKDMPEHDSPSQHKMLSELLKETRSLIALTREIGRLDEDEAPADGKVPDGDDDAN